MAVGSMMIHDTVLWGEHNTKLSYTSCSNNQEDIQVGAISNLALALQHGQETYNPKSM